MGKEISEETLDSFIEQTDVDGDEQIDLVRDQRDKRRKGGEEEEEVTVRAGGV